MLKYRSYVASTAGSTGPIFAMSLMGIVALVGAALALGLDSKAASNLQSAADSAALAGATAFVNAASPRAEDRASEAKRLASAAAESNADYALTQLDVAQIVEDPYGQHTEITVNLAFEPANPAAKWTGRSGNVAILRTASASATWGFPLCILALNESGAGFATQGATSLVAENCVIWTNSKQAASMSFSGGSAQSRYFCSGGDAAISGASVSPRPHENCEPIPDPLNDWRAPQPGTAKTAPPDLLVSSPDKLLTTASVMAGALVDYVASGRAGPSGSGGQTQSGTEMTQREAIAVVEANLADSPFPIVDAAGEFLSGPAAGLTLQELLQVTGKLDNADRVSYQSDAYRDQPTDILQPGTYAGLDISKGHVKLEPGVYHIVNAPLVVRRRATLSGEGVTIILHGTNATLSVLDEARLDVTAPTTGDTAGLVLAENRHASLKSTTPQRSRLTGSGAVRAIGTIYLPRQLLSITGDGAAEQASPLLQIVAHEVEMQDQGALKIIFDTSKTTVPAKILPERTARLLR